MEKVFNTGETQTSLRVTYNPEGSVLRRAQLRMLDMLDYLATAADAAGVSWRLDGGNVLGALRHNGFIPWDDDVDIVVDRKDYKLLCDYLKAHPHPQYVLQDPSTDLNYLKAWASLRDLKSEHIALPTTDERERRSLESLTYRGLHIDIFPYEDQILPSMQRLAGKLSAKINIDLAPKHPRLARLLYHLSDRILFPIFRCCGHIFGKRGEYMHTYGAWFYERFPENIVRPYQPISFEGKHYNAPANPDAFCKIIYGAYQDLPPKEKRNRHQVGIKFL